MKNIKSRDQFITSRRIDESLENQISWGDSYLGRLINSTLRIGKIYAKKIGLEGLAKQLKNELESLVTVTRMDEEDDEKFKHVTEQQFLDYQKALINNQNYTEKDKVTRMLSKCKNTKGHVTESFEKNLDEYVQDLEKYLQTLP